MIKAIVFDFDGVIVDSNKLKRDAWFDLFPKSDTGVKNITENVLANANSDKTRFDILRKIFIDLGKKPDEIEELVACYAKKYDEKVQQEIFTKGFMPGALEALKNLSSKYSIYINSATPEPALRDSIDRLDIKKFLKEIYGSPSAKEENLKKIIKTEKTTGENALMIGDGEVDYQAAKACGCHFVGIANKFNNWQNTPFPLLPDLIEINKIIDSI